jgi:Secretion system C-terminal sorting domain
MSRWLLTCLLFNVYISVYSQVELLSQYTNYHHRSWGKFGNLENVPADNGGFYYFFLQNNGGSPVSVTDVRFFQGTTQRNPAGVKIWPKVIQPNGGMISITSKGQNAPFRLNDVMRVQINLDNGQVLEQTFTNSMPRFRIANVVPQKDYEHLKLYFRNDDSLPRRMESLFINGKVYDLNGAEKDWIVGGNNLVNPGKVAIVIYRQAEPMKQLMPFHIAINTSNNSINSQTTSAAIRLVSPIWRIGTWDEGRTFERDSVEARQRLREVMVNGYRGTGDISMMQQGYDEFFIQHHFQPFQYPFNGDVAIPFVTTFAGSEFIGLWACADEPEGKEYSIAEVALRNDYYYRLDTLIPTMVNLYQQKRYNEHSWYADIVGMDHYAAPTAPNVIPLTWVPIVGRSGELAEALDYQEYVKFNSEPRRNSAWVQFAPGGWSQEPQDFTINIQFWMQMMAGAKSFEWYEAKGGHKFNWPLQWEEGRKAIRQLFSIKNLVMEGEYANVVTANSSRVHSRALIGPDAMIVVVVNNTARFTWNGSFDPIRYNGTLTPTSYEVEFDLPEWIDPNEVFRIGEWGEKLGNVDLQNIGGRRYRIKSTENLFRQSHVFVISRVSDNTPPEAPKGLHVVNQKDSANYILSWDFPFDNVGIAGYELYRNGELYKKMHELTWTVNDGYLPCPEVVWEIIAVDPSGNKSQPNVLRIPQAVSIEEPAISSISPDVTVNEGESATFNVDISGNYDLYQWQYNDGTGWKEVAFTGGNTAVLTINPALKAYDGWLFRCVASTLCFGKDTSDVTTLTVNTSTAVNTQTLKGLEVYPNPVNNTLNIVLPQGTTRGTLSILDSKGSDIKNIGVIEGPILSVETTTLPVGIYFIQFQDAGKRLFMKFVKR